jgi:ferredoxin
VEVSIDQDVCQSAGYCLRVADAVFALDAKGIATLDVSGTRSAGPTRVPAAMHDDVRAAALACPSGAIHVHG